MEAHFATIWESIATTIPTHPALAQTDRTVTWAQFDRQAGGLASTFVDAGLEAGSKVGHLLYNCPEFLITYFATLKIRAVPVNVNYRYVEDELSYLLDNADAEALVYHASLADRVENVLPKLPSIKVVVRVDDTTADGPGLPFASATEAPAVAPIRRDPDDVTMIYTGGTTGLPKGVMTSLGTTVEAMLRGSPMLIGEPAVHEPSDAPLAARRRADEDRSLVAVAAPPLMHNTAMGMAAQPCLTFGGCLAMTNGRHFDADELVEVTASNRAQALVVVGDAFARPVLRALEANPDRDLSALRVISSSGAMFSREVKEGLLGHLPDVAIVDLIAASEGVMGVSVSTAGQPVDTARFQPVPGLVLLGEDGKKLSDDSRESGLIALPGGALGYFRDEEKSARTFVTIDGGTYTIPGDYGQYEPDGTIRLLGRGSQCINTAGEKVYPEEVEEVVKAHPSVIDCLVFGVPDERYGQRVVGVAALAPTEGQDAIETVVASARTRLAAYKVPARLVIVADVPRTATGKADYTSAQALFEATASGGPPDPRHRGSG